MAETKTPREKLHHAIRNIMGGDLAAYYSEHRSLLGDARSQDAIKASHAGMMKILAEIDKYEIREKPTPPNGEDRRMGTDRRQD